MYVYSYASQIAKYLSPAFVHKNRTNVPLTHAADEISIIFRGQYTSIVLRLKAPCLRVAHILRLARTHRVSMAVYSQHWPECVGVQGFHYTLLINGHTFSVWISAHCLSVQWLSKCREIKRIHFYRTQPSAHTRECIHHHCGLKRVRA